MGRSARFALAGVVLALAGIGAYLAGSWLRPPPEVAGTVLDDPQPVGDLSLVNGEGERVTLAEATGRWTLVFFGFVDCPDVCPMTMARLGETYEALGAPEELQVLMVTVDPERDGPERLSAYVREFHPDFEGLGGTPEDVAAAARRFFVGYNGTGREITHSSAVALVDHEARLRVVYTQDALRGLQADVASLLDGRRSL